MPMGIVQDLLKEIDPEGSEFCRMHLLKRRTYQNLGPNYFRHIDGLFMELLTGLVAESLSF